MGCNIEPNITKSDSHVFWSLYGTFQNFHYKSYSYFSNHTWGWGDNKTLEEIPGRRTLGSPRPADHLDSTPTCLNNPGNHQKTSRMDSPEPNADERPTEEGRKGGEAVCTPQTGGREPGGRAATSQAEPPSLAGKSRGRRGQRGRRECVRTVSRT